MITYIKRILDFFIGEKSIGQFVRYLVVGFSTFFLEYFLFFMLFRVIGLDDLIANSISITIVFWFNFLMNRFWSFKSKERLLKQVLQYAVLFVFNITFSNVFMYVMSDFVGISPLISKVLVMGLIVMWNFVLYKKVIYRK